MLHQTFARRLVSRMGELEATIRALEARLLHGPDRAGAAAALLAPDFVEIGASGRLWNKGEVVEALSTSDLGPCDISNFTARMVAPGVVVATYRVVRDHGAAAASLRSSLWLLVGDGWFMTMHQGTRITKE